MRSPRMEEPYGGLAVVQKPEAIFPFPYSPAKKKHPVAMTGCFFKSAGINLSSRDVAIQVFSAPVSLTTVFGMGTGGTSPQSTPAILFSECLHTQN